MSGVCKHCDGEVPDGRGQEGPAGELLCGRCYFAIWGVSGAAEISAAVEMLTPDEPAPARRLFR